MRTIALRWPTILAIVFVFLNVDLVIMPALSEFGVNGWRLFLAATTAATIEVLYWEWYAGWIARNVQQTKPVRRTRRRFIKHGFVEDLIELYEQAKETGQELWHWWCDNAKGHLEIDTPAKKRMMSAAEYAIKDSGTFMVYVLMIILGSLPLGWAVGLAITRVYKARGALFLLLCVNALKAWGLGIAYLWAPLWAKLLLLATVLFFVVRKAIRFIRAEAKKKRQSEDEEDPS